MAKWRFYSYDVWGRGTDSWVNDVYRTDLVLDLPDNPSASEVMDAIKQNIGDKVTVDNGSYAEDAVWLEIPVKFTDENGKYHEDEMEPYGELRKETE